MKTLSFLSALVLMASVARPAEIDSRPTLTADGARALIESAVNYARAHAAPGAAIAVVDAGGILIRLERLDGTFENASAISIGKARTAVLFGKPTRVFEEAVNKGRYAMLAVPEVAPFTPLMGGVPIEIDGRIAGAIGVSGAASAAQDDEIASIAAGEFIRRQTSATAKVVHIPGDQVAAAFRHDSTLIEDPAFRVNASRRNGAGEAEVHLRDTDIFYVTQGSAELIVGGEVVSPRNIAADEIRGSEIKGGDAVRLAQGDVMSVPRGTPHWFKRVNTPFSYYVVKSRR
jgi:uncharacterized protein GlcG (DUF336 family)